MKNRLRRRSIAMLAVGLTIGLLIGVGMVVGTLVGLNQQQTGQLPTADMLLEASTAASGDGFAMATGMIDDDIEGLFILDHLTGDLMCWAIYPKANNVNYPIAQFPAQFKRNIVQDLGVEQGKKPNYVMVTGGAQFVRGGGLLTPAGCVVYVADANTGNVAAYSLAWNRNAARGMQPQVNTFQLLTAQKARNLQLRE